MEKQVQASKIKAWIEKEYDDYTGLIVIDNASELPVRKVILSIVNVQSKASDGKETPLDLRKFLQIAPPGKSYTKMELHYGMNFISGIEIAFTDSHGQSWIKTGDGELKKFPDSVDIYYKLDLPISWEYPKTERDL